MPERDLREQARRALRPLELPAAIRSLRRQRRRTQSVEEAVGLAFDFRAGGIVLAPQQVPSELKQLIALVRDRRPRVLLEIGTARGATAFLLSQFADGDAKIVTVDVGSAAWRALFYRSFAREGQVVRLIRGDSHDPATEAEIREMLAGEAVDFLFIDGDHSYDGVRRDFETYSTLVHEGGLIALHDIVPGPEELVGGVPRFWKELAARYRTRELVEDWNQGGFGIGLVSPAPRAPA